MLKYKILIKFCVLCFMLMCCVCGDTVQTEMVVIVGLLFTL
jgi:hypothetical protein